MYSRTYNNSYYIILSIMLLYYIVYSCQFRRILPEFGVAVLQHRELTKGASKGRRGDVGGAILLQHLD